MTIPTPLNLPESTDVQMKRPGVFLSIGTSRCLAVASMLGLLLIAATSQTSSDRPGLIGVQFDSTNFTNARSVLTLNSLDESWDESQESGREWSAVWHGYLLAPGTGQVHFMMDPGTKVKIEIDDRVVLDSAKSVLYGSVDLDRGRRYPIVVTFVRESSDAPARLKVEWSWNGRKHVPVGGEYLGHSSGTEAAQNKIIETLKADSGEGNGETSGPDRFLSGPKSDPSEASMPGLVGVICENPDFREPAARDVLKHLNHNWTGGPGDWSGFWLGFIEGPYTGDVTLSAEADNGLRIMIRDEIVIDGLGRNLPRVGSVKMKEGEKVPVKVWYFQDGDPSYLRVFWSWPGQERVIIDEAAFSYSPADIRYAISKLPWDFWEEDQAPFRIDGTGSEPLDLAYQHGRLLPAVGTENYQVVRSNREYPELVGGLKNTYLHAPMLAYWNGKFFLEFLSAPVGEHEAPTVTLLTTSPDGKKWEPPWIAFPAFQPIGDTHLTVSHQRMGFYVSQNGRLLMLSHYGTWPSPNEGLGIGRAVREIHKDGRIGPLYFIRYNRHAGWNESNTPFPSYVTSPDKGFVAACDELLGSRLVVQQWWEEDRSEDGFYLMSGGGFKCKAFCWYTRRDGRMVGLFKAAWSAYSDDNGKTWSEIRKIPTIIVGEAKMWGQQTEDGRYALAYNPHFEWRYPLVVNTSQDGEHFSNMALIQGELPPMRYQGNAKDVGPQYVRGITQGNGNPPGEDLWLTYSMHKEDIWVSRVQVPIRHSVNEWVNMGFDDVEEGGPVPDWNLYSPVWAPVNVAEFPGHGDKSLKFSDSDPYDYARAQRVFPESETVTLSFEVLAAQSDHGRMDIEIADRMGYRPIQISFGESGKISAATGDRVIQVAGYESRQWLKVQVTADVGAATWSLSVNGDNLLKNATFAEEVSDLQRVSFRTGEYRKLGIGKDENAEDLPNAGDRITRAVYYLNNVVIDP